ncbi:hypothetical protein [Candidatus Protochlamydia phocaeensis]|uniref:hypothetical protein n=1 Tax=Candidatus Protochlamydia phocaeensis TaxID=1414722 RepID=UPI000838F1E9|nr:hypothetical protein [Candidatus Protochlamydia phocaeensis]
MHCPTSSAVLAPYYTEKTLFAETIVQWSRISREVPNPSMRLESPKKEVKRAFEAYINAFKGLLPLVLLGGKEIRTLEYEKNFGVLAIKESQVDEKVMGAFLRTTFSSLQESLSLKKRVKLHVTEGAILNATKWWLYINDLAILGAIHADKEFHVVSEEKESLPFEDLWDVKNARPRVLGRELAMLMIAGYERGELLISGKGQNDQENITAVENSEREDVIAAAQNERELNEKGKDDRELNEKGQEGSELDQKEQIEMEPKKEASGLRAKKVKKKLPRSGIVLLPPCNGENRSVTLTACREKIAGLKSIDEITKAFNIQVIGKPRTRAHTL